AFPQTSWIVDTFFRQELASAWRVADHGIADDEDLSLRPMEHHFARRLARRANDNQGADLFTDVEFIIPFRAFFARMRRIRWMNRSARAGARPHLVCGARVVTIGQQNSANAKAGN